MMACHETFPLMSITKEINKVNTIYFEQLYSHTF